jgi:hypothetical protein
VQSSGDCALSSNTFYSPAAAAAKADLPIARCLFLSLPLHSQGGSRSNDSRLYSSISSKLICRHAFCDIISAAPPRISNYSYTRRRPLPIYSEEQEKGRGYLLLLLRRRRRRCYQERLWTNDAISVRWHRSSRCLSLK